MAVILSRRTQKDLRRIGPGKNLQRISERLNEIDTAAGIGDKAPSTKPLTATVRSVVWSTRAGDYRILWHSDGGEVVVIRVIHRSDLDRVAESL